MFFFLSALLLIYNKICFQSKRIFFSFFLFCFRLLSFILFFFLSVSIVKTPEETSVRTCFTCKKSDAMTELLTHLSAEKKPATPRTARHDERNCQVQITLIRNEIRLPLGGCLTAFSGITRQTTRLRCCQS